MPTDHQDKTPQEPTPPKEDLDAVRKETPRPESERRYEEIHRHSSDAIITVAVSPSGRFSFESLNPAAEQALGLEENELKGVYFDEIIGGRLSPSTGLNLQQNIEHYRHCLATCLPVNYEGHLSLLSQPDRRDYDIR